MARRLRSTMAVPPISEEELFLFDLEGYLVVRNVFSAEEVAAMNAAVEKHRGDFKERHGELRNTKEGTPLSGDGQTGRRDLGGMLSWPPSESSSFRDVMTHPKLVPYYHALVGEGYRLDHLPLLIAQVKGSEGFSLHGGPIKENGEPNFYLQYQHLQGKVRNSLLAAAVQLTDIGEGDGGFCVLRGSHKSNFPVPQSIVHGLGHTTHLHQPSTKAGDVVFFSEATTHGTLPWNADHERRTVLYRFAPSNIAYSRSYAPSWSEDMLEGACVPGLPLYQPIRVAQFIDFTLSSLASPPRSHLPLPFGTCTTQEYQRHKRLC